MSQIISEDSDHTDYSDYCDWEDSNSCSNIIYARYQAQLYFKSQSYSIFEIKNGFCFMKDYIKKCNLYVQLYILNGQMKILRKIQSNIIAILNKSNGFLAFNGDYIEQWRLDKMTYKTQNLNLLKEDDFDCYNLNHNDDELILTNSFCIQFWVKDQKGNWKLQQVQDINQYTNHIYDAQLNKSGDFILFTSYEKIVFFQKSKIDGGWKQINIFENFGDQFSFIDDNRIAFLFLGCDDDNCICISTTHSYPDELQTYFLDKSDGFRSQPSIFFIESKKLLCAVSSGCAYFYKQNNDKFQLISVIEISGEPYIVTCCKNGNFLLIDYFYKKEQNSRLPSKLGFLKLPNL